MKPILIHEHLAVCSWSLQPSGPEDLVKKMKLTGLSRIQLELDPLRDVPETWNDTEKILHETGVTIISGMVRCLGEDYSTLDSIRRTGGIAPDKTWEQNVKNFSAAAVIAKKLGLSLVTFHAGFLPTDESDPAFGKMRDRLSTLANIFKEHHISLGLETGQETATELADWLQQLKHPNVCVNFDPANMLLYGKGDPVEALHVLAPWIRQVHIKDAHRAKTRGEWGEEVPVGRGEVDWHKFLAVLHEVASHVNLVIEREAGDRRVPDIRGAKEFIERHFSSLQ